MINQAINTQSVQTKSRALLQGRRQQVKQRQQSMLTRSASEVGLTD